MPTNNSQYHHFVPQFILRNFQDVPKLPPRSTSGNRPRRRGRNRGRGRNDGEIHFLNLQTMKIQTRFVSRIFGLVDMYKVDLDGDSDPYHLEKKLSKLESEAARLLKKALDTFAVEDAILTLSRHERNQLRRFFFLMKYRGGGQYKRFNHASIETYDADDKDRMRAYMKAKGFTRPKDVWQANLDVFMTTEMDAKGEWMKKMLNTIFEADAAMFIGHVQGQYMSFCRSRDYENEFFVTENAYSIFEGLHSLVDNVPGTYTEYHTFAPIGPHLIVVFRSNLLRSGFEDEQQEKSRLAQLAPHLEMHNVKDYVSELEALPIRKPRTRYAQISKDDVVDQSKAVRHSFEYEKEDKFLFECFTIPHMQVEFIHDIFLEQAYTQSLIAFRNREDFACAVRAYLLRRRRGFKAVQSYAADKQKLFLDAMGVFASHELGKQVQPVYKVLAPLNPSTHASSFAARHVIDAIYGEQRPDLTRIYNGLASEASTPMDRFHDAMQANLMMFFRIKLDVIMTAYRFDNAEKDKVRIWCRQMFYSVPSPRVWLYIKVARNIHNLNPTNFNVLRAPLNLDGPEDLYLKEFGNAGIDEFELSKRLLLLAG